MKNLFISCLILVVSGSNFCLADTHTLQAGWPACYSKIAYDEMTKASTRKDINTFSSLMWSGKCFETKNTIIYIYSGFFVLKVKEVNSKKPYFYVDAEAVN